MKSYRMLTLALVAVLALLLLAAAGCESDKKDGDTGGAAGQTPSSQETAPADGGDGGETPAPPTEEPADIDLNGTWDDGGREVIITHSGDSVTAEYVVPHVCEHDDGSGQTSETDLDFMGTLDGDTLTGSIEVCGFGTDNPLGVGFRPTEVTLTVSPDGQELNGTWFNELDETDVPLTITRLD